MAKQKTVLSTERAMSLLDSLQFMFIMATMIEIEYQKHAVDTRFVNPLINQFTKRIKGDTEAIKRHIQSTIKVKDKDFALDYSLELHEAFTMFIGIDIKDVQEFINAVKNKVEA